MKKYTEHDDYEGYYCFTKEFFFMPSLVWVKAFVAGDKKDYCCSYEPKMEKFNKAEFTERAGKVVSDYLRETRGKKTVIIAEIPGVANSWSSRYIKKATRN